MEYVRLENAAPVVPPFWAGPEPSLGDRAYYATGGYISRVVETLVVDLPTSDPTPDTRRLRQQRLGF